MSTTAGHGRAFGREASAAVRVPYCVHVSPQVLKTKSGDYVQVFRVAGASFETADDIEINAWHERLNVLWRNLASPHVALWAHTIRQPAGSYPDGTPPPGFAADLDRRYRDRVGRERLLISEHYLSVVYRPTAGPAMGLMSKAFGKPHGNRDNADLIGALDACEKLRSSILGGLARYRPESLALYQRGVRWYSQPLEFFGLLVNGEWQSVPLPAAPLDEMLTTSRLLFGSEAIEYRTPTQTRVAAILGIKEYATPSLPGMCNALLTAPVSFVLTQSFTFLSKATAQGLMQRQLNRLINIRDFAASQAEEIKDALDGLTSNEFAMGEHHFSLQVLSEPYAGLNDGGVNDRLAALNEGVGCVRTLLTDAGIVVAREDLALEPAAWAQLPGNFAYRPRRAAITTRNFAAFAPFHNHPTGRPHGNHWGEATALLVTRARSPFYFSLHAGGANPDGETGRSDAGHTFICGPTGSGKTVLIGFLIAMLVKQGATQIVIDKDRGLEILVRALGGEYLPLANGHPTGFNPLQLPESPAHAEFLKTWLRLLVGSSSETLGSEGGCLLSAREESDLDQALRGTLGLEVSQRRLSRLIEFLDPTDAEGPYARLARWCHVTQGENAWVFDNPADCVVPRLAEQSIIGFDVTDFLDHPVTRAAVTLYLFHLIRGLLDGRRLVCWLDEFGRLLADQAFERFAHEGPNSWRKLNAVMCLATQSTRDVLASQISRTIVEQTPTKVFFPNSEASREDYMEGFNLSEREFNLVRHHLQPGSRQFLVKQGQDSVVCELDLRGFTAELAVISGRASSVQAVRALIDQFGPAPSEWLPEFCKRVEAGTVK